NGLSTGSASATNTYTTNTLQNGQVVTVQVTDGNSCQATSAPITMTVNPVPNPTLVSSDADNIICAGTSVTFTATPTGAGQYDFLVNDISVQNGASIVFTTNTLSDGYRIKVVVTSAGCEVTSADLGLEGVGQPIVADAGVDIVHCN